MRKRRKIGRNEPCPCGSGKKYKKCHGSVVNRKAAEPSKPVVTLPEPMSFEELKATINTLKNALANHDMLSILMSCFTTIQRINWERPNDTGMSSPYKQCIYIANLALATPPSKTSEPIEKHDWQNICELSEQIFSYYAKMYFNPENMQSARQSDEHHRKSGAAMVAFLHNLGTGVFASVEQMKEEIDTLYAPFDSEIVSRSGLHVRDYIEVSDFMIEILNKRIAEGPEKLVQAWHKFREMAQSDEDFEAALATSKAMLDENSFSQFQMKGQIKRGELETAFPREKVERFLSEFSQERASEDAGSFFFQPKIPFLKTGP